MCGLTGIFNLDDSPVPASVIKKMTGVIGHRGPDGEGFYIHKCLGIGHKRLAIIDITPRGLQPMTSKNGRWVIAFNGCIYNYLELRQVLNSRGYTFISDTDTEVILEGVSEYGMDYIKELNGMFAIALWDKRDKILYLTRDRFGIKPLYYYKTDKSLVFGSEVKSILAFPGYSIKLNYSALNEYFTFQNLFTYDTLFDKVNLVPPGTTLKVSIKNQDVSINQWWEYDFSSPDNNYTFEESKLETLKYMEASVVRQTISDVPLGAYLSGGMDSGSIAAIASKYLNRLPTFTAGFDLSNVTGVEANYDERREAQLLANHLKTEHYEQVINAGDLSWSLPKVVWHLEDLKVGMSYPNYYISRLASRFVKVCLQGTGGDELYAGYPWRYYRVFRSLDMEEFFSEYYNFWQRLVSDGEKKDLFNDTVFNNIDVSHPKTVFKNVFLNNNKLRYDSPEDHILNSLYFEIKTFLPGLLIVGDKLSMAHGLEERYPFLDNDLVDIAMKIPLKHKLSDIEHMKRIDENELRDKRDLYYESSVGKNVLRMAMYELLPEEIRKRKKQGFSAPDESWYRGENAEYIKNFLLNGKSASSEFINRKYINKIIDEHINKRINHRLLIWSFLVFEWWCRIFLNNESIEDR